MAAWKRPASIFSWPAANTNNVLALANLAFNKSLREGRPRVAEATKSLEDRFGIPQLGNGLA